MRWYTEYHRTEYRRKQKPREIGIFTDTVMPTHGNPRCHRSGKFDVIENHHSSNY